MGEVRGWAALLTPRRARRADATEVDRPWHGASLINGATGWLTLAELTELEAELYDVVQRYFWPGSAPAYRR